MEKNNPLNHSELFLASLTLTSLMLWCLAIVVVIIAYSNYSPGDYKDRSECIVTDAGVAVNSN